MCEKITHMQDILDNMYYRTNYFNLLLELDIKAIEKVVSKVNDQNNIMEVSLC